METKAIKKAAVFTLAVISAVSRIYRDLKDDDKDAAAEFKKTMQITFADDSPVWGDKDEKSELDDTLEKIIKRMGMRWRRRQ